MLKSPNWMSCQSASHILGHHQYFFTQPSSFSAHEMYLCAIQLGAAFAPAQPSGTWYHEATAAVQARRDRIAAEDAQLWHNKRKSVYEQLAASFEVFKTPALKSDHALCEVRGHFHTSL